MTKTTSLIIVPSGGEFAVVDESTGETLDRWQTRERAERHVADLLTDCEALAAELLETAPANVADYVLDTLSKWEQNPDRPDLVTGYAAGAVEKGLRRPRFVPAKCPECGSWCHGGFDRSDLERSYSAERIDAALAKVSAPTCSLGGTIFDEAYTVLSAEDEQAWMRRNER